jgi:hypothetical protein
MIDSNSSKTPLDAVNCRVQLILQPGDVVVEATYKVAQKSIELVEMNRLSKYFPQQTCKHQFKPQWCVCKVGIADTQNRKEIQIVAVLFHRIGWKVQKIQIVVMYGKGGSVNTFSVRLSVSSFFPPITFVILHQSILPLFPCIKKKRSIHFRSIDSVREPSTLPF